MNRFRGSALRTPHPALAILLALALWPALAAFAAEGFEEEPFQVSSAIAPAEVPAGGELTLSVTFKLRADVHLYKDKIKFDWEELKGATQKEVVKPKGKMIPDLLSGEPGATLEAYEGSAIIAVKFLATGAAGERAVIKGTVGYQGCTDQLCFRPAKFAVAHEVPIVAGAAAPTGHAGWLFVLKQLAKAFVYGLVLSLTPCVYPMIPITMAVIGGQRSASRRRAILLSAVYVLGIAITYAALGVLVASLGASVRLALQSPYVLAGIAAVFVLLALGMFDVVTIQAPAFLGGLGGKVVGRGKGAPAILLLGIVSGLAAGPCVAGPLLAVLTEIATMGNRLLGAAMMFTLAWGMGVLLIAAGASTGLLPKAGAWMVWVKHLIGFVLVWAAIYFLRPVVGEAAFWLASAGVLLAAAVFLGGLDALTPESGFADRAKRLAGLVAILLAAVLGFTGLRDETRPAPAGSVQLPQVDPFLHGDPDLVKEALASGQPVILDFTAEWCGYCKVLDRTTFADPGVVAELRRFRALKLDVDTRRNAELVKRYDVAGPPLIVVFDSKGKLLKKAGYDEVKDPGDFATFLKQVR